MRLLEGTGGRSAPVSRKRLVESENNSAPDWVSCIKGALKQLKQLPCKMMAFVLKLAKQRIVSSFLVQRFQPIADFRPFRWSRNRS